MTYYSKHKDEIILDNEILAEAFGEIYQNVVNEAPTVNDRILHNIFNEHSAVMILINPATGAIIDANKAAGKFYGYDFHGKNQVYIQDINQSPLSTIKKEITCALKYRHNYFIFKHKPSNGSIRTVEVYSSPIELNGMISLFSIIHDVTERSIAARELRKTESLMGMITTNSPRALLVVDHNTDEIPFHNPKFLEIWPDTGIQNIPALKASEVITRLSNTIIDNKDIFAPVLEDPDYEPVIEMTFQISSGLFIKCYSAQIMGETGECYGRLYSFEDVTREEMYANSLRMNLEKEKEINELKARIAKLTSYDIKTPLAAIQMSSEIILRYGKSKPDKEFEKHFERLSKNVKIMKENIEKIVDLF